MIRVWRYWIVRPKGFFMASQFVLLAGVALHAAWADSIASPSQPGASLGSIILLLALQLCSYFNRLDSLLVVPDFRLFLNKTAVSLAMGLVLAGFLFLVFPHLFPGLVGALAVALASTLFLFGLRPLAQWLIRHKRVVEGLLILGSEELAAKFYRELSHAGDNGKNGFELHRTVLGVEASSGEETPDCGMVVNYDQLRELTLRDGISRIVVAEPDAQSREQLATALLDCKLRGLEVEPAVESYERFNGKLWLEALRPEWLIFAQGFRTSKPYLRLKRLMDISCALVLIILTAPLLAAIAIAVLIDSRGPFIFRQVRVGLNGQTFVLYKFRTMRRDAELATGPVWASEGDERVTRMGRFLRKFRLDELPQLLNVMRGEMSFVGPRPERPYFVELLQKCVPYYGLRHYVKPGITGWAQVLYPYGASVEDAYEKMQYDLYYVKHMSFGFDLLVLVDTVRIVLFGRGR